MNLNQTAIILKLHEKDANSKHKNSYEGPYSLYAENDLQDLIKLNLSKSVNHQVNLKVGGSSLLCLYEGQTALSLFYHRKHQFELLMAKLGHVEKSPDFKFKHDSDLFYRRLFYNLVTPVVRKIKRSSATYS